MHKLLREIVSGMWAIHEGYALSMMPHIEKLMNGQQVDMSDYSNMRTVEGVNEKSGVVAVIPIQNVITKYQYCGVAGLKELESTLKQLDRDPQISGIIFDMDTPGGSASYLPNFAKTLDAIETPIVTYFSGMCCSAGYYIASRTNAIFASTETDEVGSIGTMLSFWAPNLEKKDADMVLHTIYATKSTDKNKDFNEAMKGNYDLLRLNRLDPLNETFLNNVKTGREGIDEAVLTGSVYNATEAIENGLIDGIKTFNEVVQYVLDLSKQQNSNNSIDMKSYFEKVSAIIGREVTSHEELTAEEYALVTDAMNTEPAQKPSASEGAPVAGASSIGAEEVREMVASAVEGAVNPLSEQLSGISSRLDALEEVSPAAKPSNAGASDPDAGSEQVDAWNDPANPLNAQIAKDLGEE